MNVSVVQRRTAMTSAEYRTLVARSQAQRAGKWPGTKYATQILTKTCSHEDAPNRFTKGKLGKAMACRIARHTPICTYFLLVGESRVSLKALRSLDENFLQLLHRCFWLFAGVCVSEMKLANWRACQPVCLRSRAFTAPAKNPLSSPM